jgi:AraC-type DNA-binding domain-containing proteins
MLHQEVALNLSPIQYGMELNASGYREKHVYFQGQRMLYYEFRIESGTGDIPVVPDGCIDIIIRCTPEAPQALVYGTVLKGKTIRFEPRATHFCIRFTPLQSLSFRSLAFRDVVDTGVPLLDTAKITADMCAEIAWMPSFEERIAAFEQRCLPGILNTEQAPSHGLVPYTLEQIYRSRGAIATEKLAGNCGYSARYLRRRFEETLGISPKLFSRIIRFQNSLALLLGSDTSVRNAACEQAYYDESHFLKDFKEFSLFTPTQIRTMRESKPTAGCDPERHQYRIKN